MKGRAGGCSPLGLSALTATTTLPQTSISFLSIQNQRFQHSQASPKVQDDTLQFKRKRQPSSSARTGAPRKKREKPFWDNIDNQKAFVDKLALEFGVQKPSDWYSVSHKQYEERSDKQLLSRYPRLYKLLNAVHPEPLWRSDKFSRSKDKKPRWEDINNQRARLEAISKKLNIEKLSDWYNVQRKDLIRQGGWRFFKEYTSLQNILQTLYPDYAWDPTAFASEGFAPRGHWQKKANLAVALAKAEERLGIRQPEDWYTIAMTDLQGVGFPPTVTKTGLVSLLSEKYPGHEWAKHFLSRLRLTQQKRLERTVAMLFPDVEIKANARKEAGVINPTTSDYLELDVYLPSLNLAFEYQEKHHYVTSAYTDKAVEYYKTRDTQKIQLVKEKGISLVIVPCWWDGRVNSLVASIRKQRPDLLQDHPAKSEEAIPEEIPEDFIAKEVPQVPDIGEPTLASFFTLSAVDPTNWWMLEKYDGVRGFWNPLKKTFYSRRGTVFHNLPQEVVDAMPSDTFLDGELWFGLDNFEEALRIVNKLGSAGIDWSRFRYMVFDAPNHKGTYEERYNLLERLFGDGQCKYVSVAKKEVCRDMQHLQEFFQDVVDKGGEGVILRDPAALLTPGRSSSYLKHKKFRDAEARIVNSVGDHRWECELPNGVRFVATVATKEFVRRYNIKTGDIVSFKHHGYLYASKKPKLPTLYRLRQDMTWQDVCQQWKEQKPSVSVIFPMKSKRKVAPKGHWLDIANRRKFFIGLAEKLGFDPLVPQNWLQVTRKQIEENQGRGLLGSCNGSVKQAIESTFPELGLNIPERKLPDDYWKDQQNCRAFFDDFAKQKGFDPGDTEAWYAVPFTELAEKHGGPHLADIHGGFKRALMASYPEVHFVRWLKRIDNNAATEGGARYAEDGTRLSSGKRILKRSHAVTNL